MIKLRDWVATIPDEDKHIAYVGENATEQRQFWLEPDEISAYGDALFYLDMAFDLSSVTKRDSKQVVTTQKHVTENVVEKQVTTATNDRQESFTVEEITVDAPAETDIVYLSKRVSQGGIMLTWTVLAQHTALPGKLAVTLRAVCPDGRVKKSALMVFEVDPAVTATPAAPITQNVHQQMMAEMGNLCQQSASYSDTAIRAAKQAAEAMQSCASDHRYIEESFDVMCDAADNAVAAADTAVAAAKEVTDAAATTATQVAIAAQSSQDALQAAGKMLYLKDVAGCFDIGKNLYNPAAAHYGYQLASGGLQESADYTTTDYIYSPPLGGMHFYAVSATGLTEEMDISVSGYDAEYNMVLHTSFGAPWIFSFDDTANDRSGCVYLRFSFSSQLTDVQIEEGDAATAYEPYRQPRVRAVHVQAEEALSATSVNPVQNKVVYQHMSLLETRLQLVSDRVDATVTKAVEACALANAAGGEAYYVRQILQNDVTPRTAALESSVGNMDVALEGIIAIQQSLMGGAAV